MRETVYRDLHLWFTYSEGRRVFISAAEARKMIRQGARLVEIDA